MFLLNRIFALLMDWTVAPFRSHPLWGIVLSSLVVGLIMVLAFKFTSNSAGIKRAKDRIKAGLLEMLLYRDDPVVSLKAQGSIVSANLRYMGYAAFPLLVMLPFIVLSLVQLDAWYGKRPIRIGESTILKVELQSGGDLPDPTLELPEGLVAETEAFRLFTGTEVDWAIRATGPGDHEVGILLDGDRVTKRLAAGDRLTKLSVLRTVPSFPNSLFHPAEPPIPKGSAFKTIQVIYPDGRVRILGKDVHWMIPFFLFSIVFAFLLKGPLKVEI